MIKASLQVFRWTLSLGARFGRVVPLHTLLIGLFSIASQLSMLIASFLPLKVVILLGSEGIPRYFPESFTQFDRNSLILSLSAATMGFFVLHLLAEKAIERVTNSATRNLLAKTQKIALFENQDEVAANGYQRFSRALAGGAFALLALTVLAPFYPSMAAVILGYSLFTLLATVVLSKFNAAFRERLKEKPAPELKLIGGIGFLTTFSYLIADFILWQPPGFIVALASLLASRQIMRVGSNTIADVTALYRQRPMLDALFFHGKVLLPRKLREGTTVWPLLRRQHREKWIRSALTEILESAPGKLSVTWHQLGVPDVAALRVSDGETVWLVKLVGRSRRALHECALMTEPIAALPALPWVGTTLVGKYHCLVYTLPTGSSPSRRQMRRLAVSARTKMLTPSPPVALEQRYRRSRPMIWQRLGKMPWDRLKSAANAFEQRKQLAAFLGQLGFLQQRLKSLPLTIVIPRLREDLLWLCDDGQLLITDWGEWSLDPLGAGWLNTAATLHSLPIALEEAVQHNPRLESVSLGDVELAALSFALEKEFNRQRFAQALELVSLLLSRLSEANKSKLQINSKTRVEDLD